MRDLRPNVLYGTFKRNFTLKRTSCSKRRETIYVSNYLPQILGNVYWLPGLENPAIGLTETRSDMDPLLRLLESGAYNPGALRQ